MTQYTESRFTPSIFTHIGVYAVGDEKINVRDKALEKAGRALSLGIEELNRKRVLAEGHTVRGKKGGRGWLRLYEHVSRSEPSWCTSAKRHRKNLTPVLVGLMLKLHTYTY